MKFSELKGRAVVNLEDAKKIGTVEDLMVEPESHHIVSLKVRTGMFHAAQLIPVADVKNVGSDAVTIAVGAGSNNIAGVALSKTAQQVGVPQTGNAASATSTAKDPAKAMATTTTNRASSLASPSTGAEPPIELTSLLGNKVVTDAGTMVGELSDVMVDWVDLTITGYEVHTGGIFTKAQEFIDTPGVRYGNKMITLPAELLNNPN